MTNPHLTDPLLTPFLSPTFSATTYLNSTLPPLLPPTHLPARRPAHAVPLSTLSTQTSTLLSTLTLHTTRLLTTLATLTDELLRTAPRLGYELDLLRSDVESLSTDLTSAHATTTTIPTPAAIARLHMLSTVRERLDEVVRVFGDAMAESGGGEAEVEYLVASGDVDAARKKVEAMKELCAVFKGTVKGPEKMAELERVQGLVAEPEVEVPQKQKQPERRSEERKEEGGWDGLIGQLRGLTNNI